MKIRILKSHLSKHISIAQKAISNKSSIQILEGIVFEAKDEKLYLTSTDLELSIETFVECQVIREGSVVIKSDIIGNIVRKMPEDEIEIDVEDENITITCQNSLFEIKGQNSIDYPALPDIEDDVIAVVNNSDLQYGIKDTIFATSDDESKLAITGILFELNKDNIKFVGLDGYRMAIKKYTYGIEKTNSCIVPKRAFNELSKILDDGVTEISVIKGHILFRNSNTKMYSRLIDKKYIEYNKILINDYKTKLVVNRESLLNSLDRALLMSVGGAASLTKLTIEEGVISINSNSELGKLDEKVFCNQDGENLKIAFNTKYLLDGLKVIDDDQVNIYLNHSLAPLVMRPSGDEESYVYLVLPVRLSQ
ncbi:MAG: DNA polymerase III subunit beta [Tissierellia bacterium]|nr:DNA polymerase III subunit beta [Tissierellia bacterium]